MRKSTCVLLMGLVIGLLAGCGTATPSPTLTPTATQAPSATPTATSPPPTPPPTSTPTPRPQPTPTFTPLPPTTDSPLGPWEPLPTDGLPGSWIGDIAIAAPGRYFVVADCDVYRSDDGGATWQRRFSIYRCIQSIAVSPDFDASPTVFATDGGSRLFRSSDGGETWEEIARIAQVGGASDVPVWLSISPAFPADPTLWANAGGAAYRSSDGGLAWAPFDIGDGTWLGETVRLLPNPNYPTDPTVNLLDYATVEWSPLPADLPYSPTLLASSGPVVLLGTTRGLHRSTDGGATWETANAGLPAASVGQMAFDSAGNLCAAVGSRLFRLQAGETEWQALGTAPVEFGSVLELAATGGGDGPSVLLVSTYDGPSISRDGGATWTPLAGEGLPSSVFERPLPLLSADFVHNGRAFTTISGDLYLSDDGGESWRRVEQVHGASTVVEAPDGSLLALGPGAVYRGDPTGTTWTVRYPFRSAAGQVVARFVTGEMVVAVVGNDLYLSEDGGLSWTQIGEIGNESRYVLISPLFEADHALYNIGFDAVTVSTDFGRTWIETGEGLPICEDPGSPECELERAILVPRGDTGYRLYAAKRDDFHTCIWIATTP